MYGGPIGTPAAERPRFPRARVDLPLIGSKGAVGVLGIFPDDPQRFEDPNQFYLLDAFASQTAAAVERGELAGEAARRKAEVEAERLRNSLLSSVSHDLRIDIGRDHWKRVDAARRRSGREPDRAAESLARHLR